MFTSCQERAMNTNGEFKQVVGLAMLAVAAIGLAACSPDADRAVPEPRAAMEAPATAAPPAPPPETAPKASEVLTERAPADKTSTHARPSDPQKPITKEEESTAMPLAGQANDHSNPAAQPAKR
jgi:hypothetical protein